MKLMDAIYGRSSVRKYKNDIIGEKDIEEILKAGFHAANGMNCQSLRFVVVQDKEAIQRFNNRAKMLLLSSEGSKNYPEHIIMNFKDPKSNIFHNAPNLIFVFSSPNVVTPVEDGSLAVGNMMLASYSMGYGTCYIGFAAVLGTDKDFRKECGIPDDHMYLACMAVGKPDCTIENHPRPDIKILKWIK